MEKALSLPSIRENRTRVRIHSKCWLQSCGNHFEKQPYKQNDRVWVLLFRMGRGSIPVSCRHIHYLLWEWGLPNVCRDSWTVHNHVDHIHNALQMLWMDKKVALMVDCLRLIFYLITKTCYGTKHPKQAWKQP